MDDTTWASPSSSGSAVRSAPRPFGSAGTSWSPPPRTGLVPLRPMSAGIVLGGAVRMMRRSPRWTFAPALAASIVTTAVVAIAQWGIDYWGRWRLTSAYYADYAVLDGANGTVSFVGGFLPLAAALSANAALGGMIGIAVARALVAERMTSPGMQRRIRGRAGALLGWSLLVLAMTVGALGLAAAVLFAVASSGTLGSFLVLPVGLLLAATYVPLGLWLCTRLGFTSHAIAVERTPFAGAVRRSWLLTRGITWRLLGIQLLLWVVIAASAGVLAIPMQLLVQLVLGLGLPNGPAAGDDAAIAVFATVIMTGFSAVTGAFGLVLQLNTAALLYLDTRIRREGLDLGLSRYLEQRASGSAAADPFPAPRAP